MRSQNQRERGFTLVEMMIVTTVIGVLASVTVPSLLGSSVAANEAAVIATMRAIATAQFQFQSSGALDEDGDATFEYGTLGELGALEPLRGSSAPLSRNLLSQGVAGVDAQGRVLRHGYYFRMFLPDAAGAGVAATAANAALIDATQASTWWVCVAWPVEEGTTGNCTFFVNQQGQVLRSRRPGYSGTTSQPAAGCGLFGNATVDHIAAPSIAADALGSDGKTWTLVQ